MRGALFPRSKELPALKLQKVERDLSLGDLSLTIQDVERFHDLLSGKAGDHALDGGGSVRFHGTLLV
jgi:hypothetical protein